MSTDTFSSSEQVSSFMMKQAVYLGVKVFLWARQVRSENTKVQHVPLVEKQAVNILFSKVNIGLCKYVILSYLFICCYMQ